MEKHTRRKKERITGLLMYLYGIFYQGVILFIHYPVYALTEADFAKAASENPFTMFTNIMSIILTLFQVVGGVLAIYATYTLVMSIINDDPQSRQKSVPFVIAAIALIFLRYIFQAITGWNIA